MISRKMIYEHKNIRMEMDRDKCVIFVDDKLNFKGDGYLGIKMFLNYCNNDPKMSKIFSKQLKMRQQIKGEMIQRDKKDNDKFTREVSSTVSRKNKR